MAPAADDDGTFDFNDLSQEGSNEQQMTEATDQPTTTGDTTAEVPKPKRIACVLCRKRKLKCDSQRPSCSTCIRLQHDCQYDEVRKKSGPKRGYVKKLEARLAQLEDNIKNAQKDSPGSDGGRPSNGRQDSDGVGGHHPNIAMSTNIARDPASVFDDFSRAARIHSDEESFPWEMIGLGLDEPLPTQDAIDELNALYFEKVHPSLPMLHRPRYYAAMNLAPHMRPPICLRYAMWALAASLADKYEGLQEHFYQRARKYLQQDEMRGHGESMITISHAQTWILIATFEFKMMFFPRAWMSAGRASRLSLMMGLHRLDGFGLDVKQCLPPPKDNTDKEERRRTFWMAFCVDRYSSIGTGWPMVIDERDILTDLPVDDALYESNRSALKSTKLEDVLKPAGVSSLNPVSAIVLMACLFGRNLTHLHRPSPDDLDNNLERGEFWKRHRELDNILLATVMGLPDHLRLPQGTDDPNIIFVNMSIHTSAICLHQAAIFKADRSRLPSRVSGESKTRCIAAANEIAKVMRMIGHCDLAAMNPFISFCLYVASRVMVQYLKSRSEDNQGRTTLQFLLSAMHVIKRKNPLTESFLVQLQVDMEGANLGDTTAFTQQMPPPHADGTRDMPGCPLKKVSKSENGRSHAFAYGDQGVAVYNDPNGAGVPVVPSQPSINDLYEMSSRHEITTADYLFAESPNPLSLPTRQKSPGSTLRGRYSNRSYHSPDNTHGIIEMDMSPDAGNSNHNTPNSSMNNASSSHTSNTGYSPPDEQKYYNQQQIRHNSSNNLKTTTTDFHPGYFDTSNNDLTMNLNLQNFSNSSHSMNNNQQTQSGFTPGVDFTTDFEFGPTGFTPGPSGMQTGFTPVADMSTGLTPAVDISGAGVDGLYSSDMDHWQIGHTGFEDDLAAGGSDWGTATTIESSDKLRDMLNDRARRI